jgi:hypothetical protein
MKSTALFFAALLAVTSFGLGLVVGHRSAKSPLPGPAAAAPATSHHAATAKSRRAAQADDLEANSGQRLSLPEIEDVLVELKDLPPSKFRLRLDAFVKAIAPADIPRVLAMLSNLPLGFQRTLRAGLLQQWAKMEPDAAMDFFSGTNNVPKRPVEILSILRG